MLWFVILYLLITLASSSVISKWHQTGTQDFNLANIYGSASPTHKNPGYPTWSSIFTNVQYTPYFMTINGFIPNTLYNFYIWILASDLGATSEKATNIKVGGVVVDAECNPSASDYHCGWVYCTVVGQFQMSMPSTTVEMTLAGHSHDCYCNSDHQCHSELDGPNSGDHFTAGGLMFGFFAASSTNTYMPAIFWDEFGANTNKIRTAANDYVLGGSLWPANSISYWDISRVTNLEFAFRDSPNFNGDISNWDTSKVTNMRYAFYNAKAFNGDLSNWDTSKVTNMQNLFYNAESFNGDISTWDTSKVPNLYYTFASAKAFNGDISNWDTSSLVSLKAAFRMAENLNVDLSKWDVSKVTDMAYVFYYCKKFNGDVSTWDTSKVTDLESAFSTTYAWNNNYLANWDTSSVTNLYCTFCQSSQGGNYGDLSKWDTSKVTNMGAMALSAYFFNSDVSTWDTSKVTNMDRTFNLCLRFTSIDVSKWDTSSVTNMYRLFDSAAVAPDVSKWDTSKVTDMEGMFKSTTAADNFEINTKIVGREDIVQISSGSGCSQSGAVPPEIILETITDQTECTAAGDRLNLGETYSSAVDLLRGCVHFQGSQLLSTGDAQCSSTITCLCRHRFKAITSGSCTDQEGWLTITDPDECFAAGTADGSITSSQTTASNIFSTKPPGCFVENGYAHLEQNTYTGTACSSTQRCLCRLAYTAWDVSKVTNMAHMFNSARPPVVLDLNNWDVSNVVYAGSLFTTNFFYERPFTTFLISNWRLDSATQVSSLLSFGGAGFDSVDNIFDNNPNQLDINNFFGNSFSDYGPPYYTRPIAKVCSQKWLQMTNVDSAGEVIFNEPGYCGPCVVQIDGYKCRTAMDSPTRIVVNNYFGEFLFNFVTDYTPGTYILNNDDTKIITEPEHYEMRVGRIFYDGKYDSSGSPHTTRPATIRKPPRYPLLDVSFVSVSNNYGVSCGQTTLHAQDKTWLSCALSCLESYSDTHYIMMKREWVSSAVRYRFSKCYCCTQTDSNSMVGDTNHRVVKLKYNVEICKTCPSEPKKCADLPFTENKDAYPTSFPLRADETKLGDPDYDSNEDCQITLESYKPIKRYERIYSGTCEDVPGLTAIESLEECQEAVKQSGHVKTTSAIDSDNYPVGCTNSIQTSANEGFVFNTVASSTEKECNSNAAYCLCRRSELYTPQVEYSYFTHDGTCAEAGEGWGPILTEDECVEAQKILGVEMAISSSNPSTNKPYGCYTQRTNPSSLFLNTLQHSDPQYQFHCNGDYWWWACICKKGGASPPPLTIPEPGYEYNSITQNIEKHVTYVDEQKQEWALLNIDSSLKQFQYIGLGRCADTSDWYVPTGISQCIEQCNHAHKSCIGFSYRTVPALRCIFYDECAESPANLIQNEETWHYYERTYAHTTARQWSQHDGKFDQYIVKISGKCDDQTDGLPAYEYIDDVEECNTALRLIHPRLFDLNLPDYKAYGAKSAALNSAVNPSGCFIKVYTASGADTDSKIYFNTNSGDDPCSASARCICKRTRPEGKSYQPTGRYHIDEGKYCYHKVGTVTTWLYPNQAGTYLTGQSREQCFSECASTYGAEFSGSFFMMMDSDGYYSKCGCCKDRAGPGGTTLFSTIRTNYNSYTLIEDRYKFKSGGTCEDDFGWATITDQQECLGATAVIPKTGSLASTAPGLMDTAGNPTYPPGCFHYDYSTYDTFKFNPTLDNGKKCGQPADLANEANDDNTHAGGCICKRKTLVGYRPYPNEAARDTVSVTASCDQYGCTQPFDNCQPGQTIGPLGRCYAPFYQDKYKLLQSGYCSDDPEWGFITDPVECRIAGDTLNIDGNCGVNDGQPDCDRSLTFTRTDWPSGCVSNTNGFRQVNTNVNNNECSTTTAKCLCKRRQGGIYQLKNTGKCSELGWSYIKTNSECKEAIESLDIKFVGNSAAEIPREASDLWPGNRKGAGYLRQYGCYIKNRNVYFEFDTDVDEEEMDKSCSQTEVCICKRKYSHSTHYIQDESQQVLGASHLLSPPSREQYLIGMFAGVECSNKNGKTVNTQDRCRCGSVTCTSISGMFCLKEYSLCSSEPLGFVLTKTVASGLCQGYKEQQVQNHQTCQIAADQLNLFDQTVQIQSTVDDIDMCYYSDTDQQELTSSSLFYNEGDGLSHIIDPNDHLICAYDNLDCLENCLNGYDATCPEQGGRYLCSHCYDGYGLTNSLTCELCQAGKFASSNSECLICPTGYYSSSNGLSSCYTCDTGKYSSGPGLASCDICPAGYYAQAGHTMPACKICPTGYYIKWTQQSYCQTKRNGCSDGQYAYNINSITENLECEECPEGKYMNNNEGDYQEGNYHVFASCKLCAQGKYTPSYTRALCSDCGHGQYSNDPTIGCLDCPIGYRSTGLGGSSCQLCESGKYQDDTAATACKYCPSGWIDTDLYQECQVCPAGKKAISGNTECTDCEPAYYNDVDGWYNCKLCPFGYWQSQYGGTSCSPWRTCPGGYYRTVPGGVLPPRSQDANCVTCPTGYWGPGGNIATCYTINDCPAGQYVTQTPTNYRPRLCTLCPAGYANPNVNSDSCPVCEQGKYQTSSNSASCSNCPIGTYWSTTTTPCTNCPTGYYQDNNAQINCKSCSTGQYQDIVQKSSCNNCPSGYYQEETAKTNCKICIKGTYGQDTTTFCHICPSGYYQDDNAQSECKICEIGKYTDEPFPENPCINCPSGFYQSLTAQSSCTECPDGKYQTLSGQPQCESCEPGTFSNNMVDKAIACANCPSGQYQGVHDNSHCETCPAGFFSKGEANIDCTQCPTGFFQETSAADSCTECPIGYAHLTNTQCQPCPGGKYTTQTAEPHCLSCASGGFSTDPTTPCTQCPAGYYQNNNAQPQCLSCVSGQYQNQLGQTLCYDCVAGQYQNSESQISCKICPEGTYVEGSAALACKTCPTGFFYREALRTICTPHSICESGTYKVDGSTTEDATCPTCQQGRFSTTQDASACDLWQTCQPGTYKVDGSTTEDATCPTCQQGRFSTTQDASACDLWQTCQPGTYKVDGSTTEDATCPTCQQGRFSTTLDVSSCDLWRTCPSNQVTNFGSTTVNSVCVDCTAGLYKSPTDNECLFCTPGQYQNQNGQTGCKTCPSGQFQDAQGQGGCKQCGQCPQYTERQGCGGTEPGTCVSTLCDTSDIVCVYGTISGIRPNCTCECNDNWEGASCDQKVACPSDTCLRGIVTGNMVDGCGCDCSGTTFVGDACGLCDVGRGYDPENDICQRCDSPPNINSEISLAPCAFESCPEGEGVTAVSATWPWDGSGADWSPEGVNCLPCPTGETSTAISGQCTDINECYAPDGSKRCIYNSQYTWTNTGASNKISTGTCVDLLPGQAYECNCPPGYFSEQNKQVCNICTPGKFSSTSGLTQCNNCAYGQYQPESGKTSCLSCDVLQLSTGEVCQYSRINCGGSNEGTCSDCQSNQYVKDLTCVDCDQCPVGFRREGCEGLQAGTCVDIDGCETTPCQNGAECVDVPAPTQTTEHWQVDFVGANGINDWQVSINGESIVEDPTIEVCLGDVVSLERSGSGHPLKIVLGDRTWNQAMSSNEIPGGYPGTSNGHFLNLQPAEDTTYTYICTSHPLMIGKIKISSQYCTPTVQESDYTCNCPDQHELYGSPYKGTNCEIRKTCSEIGIGMDNNGQNPMLCSQNTESISGYYADNNCLCNCKEGYTGQQCLQDIDECLEEADNCDTNAQCTNTIGSFECVCLSGYQGDGVNCQDIDECLEEADNCDTNAQCTNTIGSFECVCLSGYSGNGVTCQDIDECSSGNNCSSDAQCTNTIGSFECECLAGYEGDGVNCQDIDECSSGNNCSSDAHCTNTIGSFECECLAGYEGDGVNCQDIDECLNLSDNCNEHAHCTNTIGSFECECLSGYEGDGVSCQDIDECTTNPCDINAQCTNQIPGFECVCLSGYQGDGVNCQDIDECSSGNNCSSDAQCTNTMGSFECECLSGYEGDGVNCQDIDECLEETDNCHEHAQCTNTMGSFECVCLSGYSGNGVSCQDINECLAETDNCSSDAQCTNTMGSFECVCLSGYEGDGVSCQDIDECLAETDNCHEHAECTNTMGSFECECWAGYEGDGVSCQDIDECLAETDNCSPDAQCTNTMGSFDCQCLSGYSGNGVNCQDIDECLTETDNCSPDAQCTNTMGSFECECLSGYEGDGVNCQDIDECLTETDNCSPDAQCTNTMGSFECECLPGYEGDGVSCQDIDECLTETDNCDTNAQCTNTMGSFDCQCLSGYSGNGVNCQDIDECLLGTDNCAESGDCVNTVGSFGCNCHVGWYGLTCEAQFDYCTGEVSGCSGHGICDSDFVNETYVCICDVGYEGRNCSVNKDDCKVGGVDVCKNGATCVDLVDDYKCECVTRHYGKKCDQPIECQCPNGLAGSECATHNSYDCENCSSGFYFENRTCKRRLNCPEYHRDVGPEDGASVCEKNFCYCNNGEPTENCFEHNDHYCAACDIGFHLTLGDDKLCTSNECYCLNGTAKEARACTIHMEHLCHSCDNYYHHVNDKCELNVCQCMNGSAPVLCPYHDSYFCGQCNPGYKLVGNECNIIENLRGDVEYTLVIFSLNFTNQQLIREQENKTGFTHRIRSKKILSNTVMSGVEGNVRMAVTFRARDNKEFVKGPYYVMTNLSEQKMFDLPVLSDYDIGIVFYRTTRTTNTWKIALFIIIAMSFAMFLFRLFVKSTKTSAEKSKSPDFDKKLNIDTIIKF